MLLFSKPKSSGNISLQSTERYVTEEYSKSIVSTTEARTSNFHYAFSSLRRFQLFIHAFWKQTVANVCKKDKTSKGYEAGEKAHSIEVADAPCPSQCKHNLRGAKETGQRSVSFLEAAITVLPRPPFQLTTGKDYLRKTLRTATARRSAFPRPRALFTIAPRKTA